MSGRSLVFFVILVLLYVFMAVVGAADPFNRVVFHLVLAIIVYVNVPHYYTALGIFLPLLVYDAAQGVDPSFGIIAYGTSGLLIALISKVMPIMKQFPFWPGRVLWLFVAVAIYLALVADLSFGFDLLQRIFIDFLLSAVVLLAITFVIEPLLLWQTNREISLV